eukprot:766182-Hanusia_phi.AAC.6
MSTLLLLTSPLLSRSSPFPSDLSPSTAPTIDAREITHPSSPLIFSELRVGLGNSLSVKFGPPGPTLTVRYGPIR